MHRRQTLEHYEVRERNTLFRFLDVAVLDHHRLPIDEPHLEQLSGLDRPGLLAPEVIEGRNDEVRVGGPTKVSLVSSIVLRIELRRGAGPWTGLGAFAVVVGGRVR